MLGSIGCGCTKQQNKKTTTRVDMINNISSAEREIENSTTRTVCGCKIVVQVYNRSTGLFF
jgi:hypothetical protein